MRKKRHELTEDQKKALAAMQQDRNIFLTGKAGTGKSFLADYFSDFCEKNHMNIIKCAPTGLAAQNIGGTTVHRVFQIPTGPVTRKPKSAPELVKNADIILIDEISLCRIDVFEYIIRTLLLANNDRKYPIQLILVGDFSQIAPVMTPQDREILSTYYGVDNLGGGYCFMSPLWKEYGIETISLTNVIRQEEEDFCAALDMARDGNPACIPFILSHSSAKPIEDAIWIYPRNREVDKCNEEGLAKLYSEEFVFATEYSGKATEKDFSFGRDLHLKVGAKVMVTSNGTDSAGIDYYNGDMGHVKKIAKDGSTVLVTLDDGAEVKLRKIEFPVWSYEIQKNDKGKFTVIKECVGKAVQFPLKLGYAITIHKSQGQTFEKLNFAPSCFEAGQFYVAVSRCKTIENLYIKGRSITKDNIIASQDVRKFMDSEGTYDFFGGTQKGEETLKFIKVNIPERYEKAVKELVSNMAKADGLFLGDF